MIKTKINSAKKDFYNSYFERNRYDIKKNWDMIKKISGITKDNNRILKLIINNIELVNKKEIAEGFNNFFSSIPKILADKLPTVNIDPLLYITNNSQSSILLNPIESSECLEIIKGLKNSRTTLDHIPVTIFKRFIKFYISPLIDIINLCLKNGIFPNHLKLAKIIPIFKKGEKSDPNNYRPIAVLSYISKIFEKCIHRRILNFLDKFNILSPNQFGFRPRISTADALLKFIDFQYNVLNDKKYSCNIFIDFRKAFDTVDHSILLRKLDAYGVRGSAHKLLTNYLSNRRHYVSIENTSSNEHTTNMGIPQGSILGPLLFLIYINDLPNVSKEFNTILFADYTTLSFKSNDLNSLIRHCNVELSKFFIWSCANKLSVNTDKTCFNLISNLTALPYVPEIKLNNQILKRQNIITFLGVKIDEKLKFNSHITYVSSKISRSIGILNKLKAYVPKGVLRNLYFSFIYPYISYCIIIWGATFQTHLNTLNLIHKRSIRVINNANYLAHTLELFCSSKILKLEDLFMYTVSIHMFKYHRASRYVLNHTYNTRFRGHLLPQFQRLTLTQHSIEYMGPIIWNSLPLQIKEEKLQYCFISK